MKVYILIGSIEYYSDTVLAVFDNEEDANRELTIRTNESKGDSRIGLYYNSYDVQEFEVQSHNGQN